MWKSVKDLTVKNTVMFLSFCGILDFIVVSTPDIERLELFFLVYVATYGNTEVPFSNYVREKCLNINL